MEKSSFARNLRNLIDKTGTTQKALAEALSVRPQTISYYVSGETQPNADKLLKLAEYFNVTTDYLITGIDKEDKPIVETLGLSQQTVENMKLVKDNYFEDDGMMLSLLDRLLGDKEFYETMAKVCEYKKLSGDEDYNKWKCTRILDDYFLRVL